jgi:hypothetical protein
METKLNLLCESKQIRILNNWAHGSIMVIIAWRQESFLWKKEPPVGLLCPRELGMKLCFPVTILSTLGEGDCFS